MSTPQNGGVPPVGVPATMAAGSPTAAAIPAPLDSDARSHPAGLYVLFGVEMWERFSFYGMRAILPLYLASAIYNTDGALLKNPGRGWSQADASILMGWYGGMCYFLPIIGGIIADRLLGTHRSMLIGGILIALGHIVLGLTGLENLSHSKEGLAVFIGGLGLIALGTGHFKPCVSVMVGQLYADGDKRRDAAFAIFYMGINIGALLGQFTCSLLGEKYGWHYGFSAAAVGMFLGLLMYLFLRPTYLRGIGDAPVRAVAPSLGFFGVSLVLAAVLALVYYNGTITSINHSVEKALGSLGQVASMALQLGVATAVILLVLWFIAIQQPGERGPTASIFLITAFVAIFWLGFEQSATSLNFFAKNQTDRMVAGWEVPAGWLQNFNPFFVIALSPLFAMLWSYLATHNKQMSQGVRVAIGLIMLGIGYVFVTIGADLAADGASVAIFWLAATYFFHTVGELFLSPTGLSFVTKVAPVRFVSLLMGVWFISSFLAHLIGGYVASTVEAIEKGEISLPWYAWGRLGGQADFFLMFVIASVLAGLVILAISPFIKRMQHGRG